MSWSNRCPLCSGSPPDEMPEWRLDRHGDAVISWSCDEHLGAVMRGLQRPQDRRTEVSVRPTSWNECSGADQ